MSLSIIISHVDKQIQVNYTFTPITRYRFPAILAFTSYPVRSDKIWRNQTATDYSYPLIDTLLNYSMIKAKSVSCCVCFFYTNLEWISLPYWFLFLSLIHLSRLSSIYSFNTEEVFLCIFCMKNRCSEIRKCG